VTRPPSSDAPRRPAPGAPGSVQRANAPISVQTRFERFPASVKGAFVMRGADGNPHAIRIEWARVGRVPEGPGKPAPVEDRLFDVAPTRDLFVPFEIGVADLDPGWYAIESSVQVDGGRSFPFSSRAFTISWPRTDVRRGTIHLGRPIQAGGVAFFLDRVELGSDSAVVLWRDGAGPAGAEGGSNEPSGGGEEGVPADAMVVADGRALEVLPRDRGIRLYETRLPGERRTVSYPVPRAARSVSVVLRLASGGSSDPVELSLR
jgi:hypothetical protein